MQEEQLHVLSTNEEIDQLIAYLQDKDFIAYDCETDGLSLKANIVGLSVSADPNVGYYVITAKWDIESKQLIKLPNREKVIQLLKLLQTKQLITQNGLVDWNWTFVNYGVQLKDATIHDIMISGHLLNENVPQGLKERGYLEFGEDATKEQEEMKASVISNGGLWEEKRGGNKEMYKADSHILGKYGAKDAILTLRLFYVDVPKLYDRGLDKFFYEDESMPLFRGPTYDLNTVGLKIDMHLLNQTELDLKREIDELKLKIVTDITPYTKDLYPGTKKSNVFNIGSTKQLAWLLFVKLGYDWKKLTKAGNKLAKELIGKVPYTPSARRVFVETLKKSLNEKGNPYKLENYIKCDKTVVAGYAEKHTWCKDLLQHAKAKKMLSTYVIGIQNRVQYGIIHPSFLQIGTKGTRFACIAEGQKVMLVEGDKHIEDVKVGDLAFCFKDNGKPSISKVLNVYDNGSQSCIKLNWKGTNGRTGSLICTPDHKLKTTRGWVEAKDLTPRDSIFHLKRASKLVNGRVRLYGHGYYMENEEVLLKKEYFNRTSSDHIHHKNEIKHDNRIENLEVLSSEEHCRLHTFEKWKEGKLKWKHLLNHRPISKLGKDSKLWKYYSKFQLLRMLATARGRVSLAKGIDFDCFKNKCELEGINLKIVKRRYTYRGEYITSKLVQESIINVDKLKDAPKYLGVSFYEFKRLCQKYDLEYNHSITSIENVGIKKVYDLEIEEHHNFIVNELCVHNCRNPNFQNNPRDDKRIKRCIIARTGKVFVGADASQIEARVFASFSGDYELMKCFEKGEDFYSIIGMRVFNKTDCTPFKEGSPEAFGIKYKKLRHTAKTISLAVAYGAEAPRLSDILGCSMEEAQDIIDAYWEAYPTLKEFVNKKHHEAVTNGVVYNLFGRPRHLPEAKFLKNLGWPHEKKFPGEYKTFLNMAVNAPIQNTAGSIINRASIRVLELCAKEGIDARMVIQVHDQVVLECNEGEEANRVAVLLQDSMENTCSLPGVKLEAIPLIGKSLADV